MSSNTDVSFDPIIYLKENPLKPIEFQSDNPKREGSGAHIKYESYKNAKTYEEFISMDGKHSAIKNDYSKGFLKILNDNDDDLDSINKSKITPKDKKNIKDKKKNKKKKEKNKKKKKEKKIKKEIIDDDIILHKPATTIDIVNDIVSDIVEGSIKQSVISEELIRKKQLDERFEQSNLSDSEDDEWPVQLVDGVKYFINETDKLIIDWKGTQIGYYDINDKSIDFIDDECEEIHNCYVDKL